MSDDTPLTVEMDETFKALRAYGAKKTQILGITPVEGKRLTKQILADHDPVKIAEAQAIVDAALKSRRLPHR
jgi:hypothetical protein